MTCCDNFPDCSCNTESNFCSHGRHLSAGCVECQREVLQLRAENYALRVALKTQWIDAKQGQELKRTQELLDGVRVDLKWLEKEELEAKNLPGIRERVSKIIREIQFPETLGAWHVYLGRGNTFCVHLHQVIGFDGKPWVHFDWHGGAVYGSGIKDPDYAKDLMESLASMATRLQGMTVEEVKRLIDNQTNEIDPPEANRNGR